MLSSETVYQMIYVSEEFKQLLEYILFTLLIIANRTYFNIWNQFWKGHNFFSQIIEQLNS